MRRRHHADGLAAAFADEPEVVTAEAVHVRVNDGDRRGSCDHGLDSVTAISKNREAGLGCKVVGRDDHAASRPRRFDHRALPLSCHYASCEGK